ncbi:MAG: nickel-dependent hydrogenase large subunit [Pseudomonadota bacterium]
MSTPPIRRYVLHVGGAQAQVLRSGPADVLTVAAGKSLHDGLALAGLLFPICPRAHQIAALRAAEQASGVVLPRGQAAAREMVLLSEGIFSAVWRAALSWANVLNMPPPAAAVQDARQASQALEGALFQSSWARIGGASMAIDREVAGSAVTSLTRAFDAVLGLGDRICTKAQDVRIKSVTTSALNAKAEASGNTAIAAEETPRLLMGPAQQAATLEPWLSAQRQHGANMLAQLRQLTAELREDTPAGMSTSLNGSGFGIAMTARGRLRHAITLQDGVIARWSAKAPTDWNFSPNGAACCIAAALHDVSDTSASMLVAALDPCAPCDVVLETAHA